MNENKVLRYICLDLPSGMSRDVESQGSEEKNWLICYKKI